MVLLNKNRTLIDMVNAMLLNSSLSIDLWGEALLTTCYILNCVHSKISNKLPYEIWNRQKPNLGHLKVWGFKTLVKIPNHKRNKVGDKTIN